MGRIIVDFTDDLTEEVALLKVLEVVRSGRISVTTKGVKHFCWYTTFEDGHNVSVRRKKKKQMSDSFVVGIPSRL